jgi:4-amino-4-deoxy-L-arabinose transferase-like glycosyltransferase
MKQSTYVLILGFVLIANLLGLFDVVFTGDSALYACIAKSFVQSGNYMDIFVFGADWLDKPHFPFWICALSMKIFGINAFAYKLPSLLFFMIGVLYTYQLAKKIYNETVAQYATLILSASLHIIISNNDTRAEAILIGVLTPATYYIYLLSLKYTHKNLLLSACFTAAAVMTKGPFVLIIPFFAVLGTLILPLKISQLNLKYWFLLSLLILVFIFPELYALYQQFDLHPEKIIFGQKGVSGIRFFFWDSQFGRFFNSGPIKGQGDKFFFLHTMLWAFAPWSIIAFIALSKKIRSLYKKETNEYLNLFAFGFMFIVFSLSAFQLPHYLNILYPYLSIITANYIATTATTDKLFRLSVKSIYFFSALLILLMIITAFVFQPEYYAVFLPVCLFVLGVIIWISKSMTDSKWRLMVLSVGAVASFSIFLNLCFYPSLLKYQSGVQAAEFLNKEAAKKNVVSLVSNWDFEFYLKQKYTLLSEEAAMELPPNNNVIFAEASFLEKLSAQNIKYKIVRTFDHFHITTMNMDFFNAETRHKELRQRYLIQIM